jgi:cystathionine beta-lyase/cystathionine gamma-synthase
MFSAAFGVEDSHVVVGDDVYGGTRRLFDQVRRQSAGIETIYADLTDIEALTAAIAPELGFRGRLNTVSILSCTPPPNTSTATPTWWGDVVVVGNNTELRDHLAFLQNAAGAIQGPFDSFLALRGVKTLSLRMEQQSASALQIACSCHESTDQSAILKGTPWLGADNTRPQTYRIRRAPARPAVYQLSGVHLTGDEGPPSHWM